MVINAIAMASAPKTDLDGGGILLWLRRWLSPRILNCIPAPLGFLPA
jgi:hypothetical protein